MRTIFCLLLFVGIVFFNSAHATDILLVAPTTDSIKVYKNQTWHPDDMALFTVSMHNRLQVLDDQKQVYKIKDEKGQIGWLEKRFTVPLNSNKTYNFDNAYVDSYNDIRSPIYIIDSWTAEYFSLKLDRSFKDALRQNVDRETAERF